MRDRPRLDLTDAFARCGNALTRWALGFGLLSLHATTFAVVMVALVLWNIYDRPRDLWVGEVFRNWGALLAFHAICVTAGTIAWRLMRAEQQALAEAQRVWTQALPPPRLQNQAQVQPAALPILQTAGPYQVGPVPGPEPPPGPSRGEQAAAALRRADKVAQRTLAASLAMGWAGFNQLSDLLGALAMRLVTWRRSAAAASEPADPTITWPQAPVRKSPDDEAFVARFAGHAATSGAAEGRPGEDVVIDMAGITTAPADGISPAPVKAPGMSWVETATFAWMRPHDEEQPAAETQPERANGSTAPDIGRPNPAGQ